MRTTPSPQDQEMLKRALDATQREQRLEQRITVRVLKAVGDRLESGFIVTRLVQDLQGLMQDSAALLKLLEAIRQLERQPGYEGLEAKLIEVMDGGAQQPAAATPDPDPGSPPPVDSLTSSPRT